jgi:hypothetical protein
MAEAIIFTAPTVTEGYALNRYLENHAGDLGIIDSKNYQSGGWSQHNVIKINRKEKGRPLMEIVQADTDHPCVLKIPQIEDREKVIKELLKILKGFNHKILIVEDWP